MSRLTSSLSALVLVAATVALAACGGSSGANSSANAGTTQNASRAKFDQCLKDQGVTPPSRPPGGAGGGNGNGPPVGGGNGQPPGGGPGAGGGDPKFAKALQACAKYRPQGAGGGGRPGGQQNIQAFTPYLTCLKDQGLAVKVSDGFNALRNLKRDDPKVQAAFKACQSKLPQRPQGAPPNGNASPSTTPAQS
jgi:hypothetical protein